VTARGGLPFYSLSIDSFADALPKLNENGEKTADLRNVFDGINSPIYTDYAHMSDFGNEIIAEQFFKISFPVVRDSAQYE